MRTLPIVSLLLASCAAQSTAVTPFAVGRAAVQSRGCAACHDPGDGSLSGQTTPQPGTSAYGSNLTPDVATGLGGWSEDAVVLALRAGQDPNQRSLCPPMPRYPSMSLDEAQAVALYLRALPPVHNDQIPPSTCPPAESEQDAGAMVDAWFPEEPELPDAAFVPDLRLRPAPPDLALAGCAPRINEVQTAGEGGVTDEFVELYNPCGRSIGLAGWRLVYRSASGTHDEVLVELGGALASGGFMVCAGRAFSGEAELRYGGAVSTGGGGLALRDSSGTARDALGWGSATNDFVRGAAAAAPAPGRSLARHPDGTDSGWSAVDFTIGAPTPGAPNG